MPFDVLMHLSRAFRREQEAPTMLPRRMTCDRCNGLGQVGLDWPTCQADGCGAWATVCTEGPGVSGYWCDEHRSVGVAS